MPWLIAVRLELAHVRLRVADLLFRRTFEIGPDVSAVLLARSSLGSCGTVAAGGNLGAGKFTKAAGVAKRAQYDGTAEALHNRGGILPAMRLPYQR
jgi:hypothetical protein